MAFPQTVLILAPHTDDAELGCGGTMARMIDHGVEVHVAVFSTARASLPEGADPDQLEREFRDAMAAMGVPEERLYVYDYTVRKLSYARQEVLEEMVSLRDRCGAAAVLLPSSRDVHQDHQVVYHEGLRAFKDRTLWGYELPWNHIDFPAQAFVQLEERHLAAKWHALTFYRSQHEKGRRYFDRAFIEGLARVRGTQVNTDFAEAFEVIRVKV